LAKRQKYGLHCNCQRDSKSIVINIHDSADVKRPTKKSCTAIFSLEEEVRRYADSERKPALPRHELVLHSSKLNRERIQFFLMT
jgi:hypothetical protein